MEIKTTPFTKYHIERGAKMAPFAGYNMPIEYSGISDEHACVRSKIGVFDVSHMGEIWVKGANAERFLQKVTSNNVAALYDGKIQYSCFPNGEGGIVDDLLVYRINAETFLLVVNASNVEKDWNFLCKYAPEFGLTPGKELYNASDEIAQLAVQGPLAMKVIQKLCNEKVEDMEYYTFKKVDIVGIKQAIVSATGYTGAGGCEIYVANEDADKLWNAVFEAGKEEGIQPIGLGARDTLRLEMGFCLYGNDIDDTTSPLEAGLGWVTKFIDGKNFIDRDKMERLKAEGIKRKLVGFVMEDRGIPRHGYALTDSTGTPIGVVTSGTQIPTSKLAVGMGYVKTEFAAIGSEIFVEVRGKLLKAKVTKPPFTTNK